jgi:hypothetical protein
VITGGSLPFSKDKKGGGFFHDPVGAPQREQELRKSPKALALMGLPAAVAMLKGRKTRGRGKI